MTRSLDDDDCAGSRRRLTIQRQSGTKQTYVCTATDVAASLELIASAATLPRKTQAHLPLLLLKRVTRIRGGGDWSGDPTAASAEPPLIRLSTTAGPPLPSAVNGGPPEHATLVNALCHVAATVPATRGVTYVEGDSTIFESYAELLASGYRTRTALWNLGLSKGQPLVMQVTERQRHLHVLWGCFLSGITPVTIAIPPKYEATNAVFLKLQGVIPQLDARDIIASAANVAPLQQLLSASVGVHSVAELDYRPLMRPQIEPPIGPEDILFYQLTSGSTGIPKCIPERHCAVISHIRHSTVHNGYTEADVTLNWLPFDHVVPMLTFHLADCYLGRSAIQVPTQHVISRPMLWMDLIEQYRVSHSWSPNFGFKLVAQAVKACKERPVWNLMSVKLLMNAGEQVTAEVCDAFLLAVKLPSRVMQPAFGMAEVCTCMTYNNEYGVSSTILVSKQSLQSNELVVVPLAGATTMGFMDLGPPSPGVEIRITENGGTTVLRERQVGHLQIRGPCVMLGYHNHPKANAECLIGDGWFDSGDLGFIHKGRLALTGRAKEMIIIRGANFYCYEIEEIVTTTEGTIPARVAATSVYDQQSGSEVLLIFFVPVAVIASDRELILLHRGQAVGGALMGLIQRIRSHITKSLGLAPRHIIPVTDDNFHRTTSGKIQRGAFKKQFEEHSFDEAVKALHAGASAQSSNLPSQGLPAIDCFEVVWQRVDPIAPALSTPALMIHLARIRPNHLELTPSSPAGLHATIAIVMLGASSHAPAYLALDSLLSTCQIALSQAAIPHLVVVTCRVQVPRPLASSMPSSSLANSSAWGLGGVLAMEHPRVNLQLIDDPRSGDLQRPHLQPAMCNAAELRAVWHETKCHADRLRRNRDMPQIDAKPSGRRGSHILVGGLGGLGLHIAPRLLSMGAQQLHLISRSGRVARGGQGLDQQLAALNHSLVHVRCSDVSLPLEAQVALTSLVPAVAQLFIPHVEGGELISKLVSNQLFRLFAWKAWGAWNVRSALERRQPLAISFYASSVAAFGGIKTAGYSAGNSYLDATSQQARGQGLRSTSSNLPVLADAGVGAASFALQLADPGFALGAAAVAMSDLVMVMPMLMLGAATRSPVPLPSDTVRVIRGLHGVWVAPPVDDQGGFLTELRLNRSESSFEAAAPQDPQRLRDLETFVVSLANEALAGGAVNLDMPLMDAGVDSVMAPQLAGQLEQQMGITLSPLLIFEHPTPRAIASHLATFSSKSGASIGQQLSTTNSTVACRADGWAQKWSCLTNSAELAALLGSSGDAISSVPAARWAADEISLHGSFVAHAQHFDNAFFRISPLEAAGMDPQQRLLLQVSYASLHALQQRKAVLAGSDAGIFLGLERPDWPFLSASRPDSIFDTTADTISVASGRLSFTLGLHGPCESLDTACSSSLVASHAAAAAITAMECSVALVSAVNLNLMRRPFLLLSAAGMLSPDGRCKTLDASANGYVRAEGVAAYVVADASVLSGMTLAGSAVRQDGRSASLTAPNSSAQRILLRAALGASSLADEDVAFIEMHGTGTALGDPTETSALSSEVGLRRPFEIGATKSNMGHAEPAAGMLSLSKVAMQMDCLGRDSLCHLSVLSPFVCSCFADRRVRLPTQQLEFAGGKVRTSGVNAFGYSGTIAHVLAGRVTNAHPISGLADELCTFRGRAFLWNSSNAEVASSLVEYAKCWTMASPSLSPSAGVHCVRLIIWRPPSGCLQKEPFSGTRPLLPADQLVLLFSGTARAFPDMLSFSTIMALLQSAADRCIQLVVVTCGTQLTMPSSASATASNIGCGGMQTIVRICQLEHPTTRTMGVDVSNGRGSYAALLLLRSSSTISRMDRQHKDCAVALDDHGLHRVARLRPMAPTRTRRLRPSRTCGPGAFIITGGLGGLGLKAAVLLHSHRAEQVVLASRSAAVARCEQQLALLLRQLNRKVSTVTACDVADPQEVSGLISAAIAAGRLIRGAFHTAGTLDRSLLQDVGIERLFVTMAPKAMGAAHLHHAVHSSCLEAIFLFSSVAAAIPNIGQAVYAASNANLDSQALIRRALGLRTCSLMLPLVQGIGMGAANFSSRQLKTSGMVTIASSQYATWLQQLFIGAGHGISVRIALTQQSSQNAMEGTAESECAIRVRPSAVQHESMLLAKCDADQVTDLVMGVINELTGHQDASISTDTPLMDAGIDSLASTELSRRLQDASGVQLTATMAFEHSTPRAIMTHLTEQLQGCRLDHASSAKVSNGHDAMPTLLSSNGRWPGGSHSRMDRDRLTASCADAICSVPSARWTMDLEVKVGAVHDDHISCIEHGGFIFGLQMFDHVAFSISRIEASTMDPQHRILLEAGYAAFHDAEQRRVSLFGSPASVFLGIERPDWILAQPPTARLSVYSVVCDSASVAAGRLAFHLGLNGPSVSMDTACSSALAALHGASRLSHPESFGATMAVTVKLDPMPALATAAASMLSSDGRCKTLDQLANGYVRSECIGAFILRMTSSHGTFVMHSSAVRQDGRSASLTAPNGSMQQALMLHAVQLAALDPTEINTLETHGTGTALGDPTEARALSAVYAASIHDNPGSLGTVKASVGHSEAASGILSIMKIQGLLSQQPLSGNAQLRVVNPLIVTKCADTGCPCFLLPTQGVARPGKPECLAGVSSFGFSGTIAHSLFGWSGSCGQRLGPGLAHLSQACGFSRQTFLWVEQWHPLHQLSSAKPDDSRIQVRCPAIGLIRALVADHVVHGKVIFPAVGYLEMARAAVHPLKARSSLAEAALCNVFFVLPLVLDDLIPHRTVLECEVSGLTFAVRQLAHPQDETALHCSGDMHWALSLTSTSKLSSPSLMREVCSSAYNLRKVYDGFHRVGLQYGPSFRALACAWGSESAASTFGRLTFRRSSQGVPLHPGDLDSAMQLSQADRVSSPNNMATRLPFALDEAILRAGTTQLWAATEQVDGPDVINAVLGRLDNEVARLLAFRLRGLTHVKPPVQGALSWSVVEHPFLQTCQVALNLVTFRAHPSNELYSLVEGHLPDGQALALFPAAGFLEMTNAACRTALSNITDTDTCVSADEIQLLRPLVVDNRDSAMAIECSLSAAGALKVLSSSAASSDVEVCMEAHGVVETADVLPTIHVPAFRDGVAVQGAKVVDLELGTSYDVFQGPVHKSSRSVFGRLLPRADLKKTFIHPADLHAVVHTCVLHDYSAGSSAPLPYAMSEVKLAQSRIGQRLAVHSEQRDDGSWTGNLFDIESTLPVAQLIGLRLRPATHALPLPGAANAYHTCWYPHATNRVIRQQTFVLSGGIGRPHSASLRFRQSPGKMDALVYFADRAEEVCTQRSIVLLETFLCIMQHTTLALIDAPQLILVTNSQTRSKVGAWGLARCARLEVGSEFRMICIEGILSGPVLCGNALENSAEHELQSGRQWRHARLERVTPCKLPARSNGLQGLLHDARLLGKAKRALKSSAHLVAGGTSGIGLLTARWLANSGVSCLSLVSRGGAVQANAPWGGLPATNYDQQVVIRMYGCDLAERSGVCRTIVGSYHDNHPVTGWWHASGVLADQQFSQQNADRMRHVYAAKAASALTLHQGFAAISMNHCTLFSSAAGLLGSGGQANYGAANSSLDLLAARRRATGGTGVSIQWGPWAHVGMAATNALQTRLRALGYKPLTPSQGIASLEAAVVAGLPVLGMMGVSWSQFESPSSLLMGLLPSVPRAASPQVVATNLRPTTGWMLETVQAVAGHADIDADMPLMEAGIDSLASVELRNRIQVVVGKADRLPASLVFDHPSARQLLQRVAPVMSKALRSDEHMHSLGKSYAERELAGTGVSACFSGLLSLMMDLVTSVSCGKDMMMQVPLLRWDVNALPVVSDPVASARRHLGFIGAAEFFDSKMFRIGFAEASAMDPQQRLLLEHGYYAFHNAQLSRAHLQSSHAGVFVGIDNHDFAVLLTASPLGGSVFAATGSGLSVANGRLSYVLGLHGPSVSCLTACSSALVAYRAATHAHQLDGCATVLVAAAHLMLLPEWSTCYAAAGMLSATGRSHTFDARADGYARSEATGAVALQSSGDARRLSFWASGSAVAQDGRSASLTAPNGLAQQSMLRSALGNASARSLLLVEAHGTGTSLGDPIEVGSLVAIIIASGTSHALAGGFKANAGHSEPAAGLTGLLKLVGQSATLQMGPNAQLRTLNSHILSSMPNAELIFTVQLTRVRGRNAQKSSAGVSSFGYSGTIAHVIISLDEAPIAIAPVGCSYRRLCFPWQTLPVSKGHSCFAVCWMPVKLVPTVDAGSVAMLSLNCTTSPSVHAAAVPRFATWHRCVTVVLFTDHLLTIAPLISEGETILRVSQDLIHSRVHPRLLCITRSQVTTCGAGWWGYARVLRREQPSLQVATTSVAGGSHLEQASHLLLTVGWTGCSELQQTKDGGQVAAPKLCNKLVALSAHVMRPQGTHLITGGLGGLGMRAASMLLDQGSAGVVLCSRNGHLSGGGLQPHLTAISCDVSDQEEVGALIHKMQRRSGACSFDGILHAAGNLQDGLIVKMSVNKLIAVFPSKANAAARLNHGLQAHPLQTWILFSSIATTVGTMGQANYASANSYLNALASYCAQGARLSQSIEWPLVSGAGMGNELLQVAGKANEYADVTLPLEQYAAALLSQLCGLGLVVVLPKGSSLVAESSDVFSKLACTQGQSRPTVATGHSKAKAKRTAAAHTNPVMGIVQHVLGPVDTDTLLMEAGLDSLGSLELRNMMLEVVGAERELPFSLALEYPTTRSLMSLLPGGEAKDVLQPSTAEAYAPAKEAGLLLDTQPALHEPAPEDSGVIVTERSFNLQPALEQLRTPVTLEARETTRVLFLHGEAGDKTLSRIMLQATGWWNAEGIEFICANAPYECEAKPHLHKAFQGKHYSKPFYYSWRLYDERAVAAGVSWVQQLLHNEGCDGVAGICEGSIIAALVAMQTPEVQLFVNFCAGPLSMVETYFAARPEMRQRSIAVPSLHLLSFQDQLFTYEQLSSVPSCCKDPTIIHHPHGHVIPMLTHEMNSTIRRLRQANGVPSPLPTNQNTAPGAISDASFSEPNQERDSMDVIASLMEGESSSLSTKEVIRGHVDFLVLLCVIFHHSRMKFLHSKVALLTPMDKQVYLLSDAFTTFAMPTAIILLGVQARANRSRSAWPRLMSIIFVFWLFTLSGLPYVFNYYVRQRLDVAGQRAVAHARMSHQSQYWFAVERLTTPLWFLIALFLWETISIVVHRVRMTRLLAVAALLAHFWCHSNNCAWPFWRDGAFSPLTIANQYLAPLGGHLLPTAFSRAVNYWWLYASAPLMLPADFPAQLPGDMILKGRWPTALRLFWLCMLGTTIYILGKETLADGVTGSGTQVGRFQDALYHGIFSYGCSAFKRTLCIKHVDQTVWSFADFSKDVVGCAIQMTLAVGSCALVPRQMTPFARYGQMAIFILCLHEYALALLDYPIAQAASVLSSSFELDGSILAIIGCGMIAIGIAQVMILASRAVGLFVGSPLSTLLLSWCAKLSGPVANAATAFAWPTIRWVQLRLHISSDVREYDSLLTDDDEEAGVVRSEDPRSPSQACAYSLASNLRIALRWCMAFLVAMAVIHFISPNAVTDRPKAAPHKLDAPHLPVSTHRSDTYRLPVSNRTHVHKVVGHPHGHKNSTTYVQRSKKQQTVLTPTPQVAAEVPSTPCIRSCAIGLLSTTRMYSPEDGKAPIPVQWCCPNSCPFCAGGDGKNKCNSAMPRWCCPFTYGRVDGKMRMKGIRHLNECANSSAVDCLVSKHDANQCAGSERRNGGAPEAGATDKGQEASSTRQKPGAVESAPDQHAQAASKAKRTGTKAGGGKSREPLVRQ